MLAINLHSGEATSYTEDRIDSAVHEIMKSAGTMAIGILHSTIGSLNNLYVFCPAGPKV